VSAKAGSQGYDKRISYPSIYLKRLSVTVVLNDSIPLARTEVARDVLSSALGLSSARGDTLRMVRAPFSPVWDSAWQGPEGASLKLRLASILSVLIIGSVVVLLGFWRLSSSLAALARTTLAPSRPEPVRLPAPLPPSAPAPSSAPPAPGYEESEALIFAIDAEQAAALGRFLATEDPSNIALVASHLRPESRAALLDALPPALAGQAVIELSRPRFVDPEAVMRLKDEVERRVRGMVGGPQQALEAVERAGEATKRAVIERLSMIDPALAPGLRRRALLMDDLIRLSEEDWDLLAAAVETEDWADALPGAPPELADRVRAHLPRDAWSAVERLSSSRGGTAEERARARERVIATAWSLMREHRIANPIPERPA
jgi:hypothetical protein